MRTALLLFAFGLLLRTLFWCAGDAAAAWDPAFQGDAPEWQRLAAVMARGGNDELLRLPLRPPGMLWFVAALWDGAPETAWRLRLLFAVLGALVAPIVWLLLRRHVSAGVAATCGWLCASATNLIVLGSGLHSELPYLVLVLASLFDQERLRTAPASWPAARWGALHAVLCLLRAEHALTFAAFAALLALQRAPRWLRTTGIAAAAFAVVLLPWHVIAWRQIDAYNRDGAPALPQPDVAAPGGLPWSALALDAVRALPAFQQRPVFLFVTACVQARGGTAVEEPDLQIVRDAYGVWPEPLGHPFVCLYGGLNFFLGNTPEAAGGFSQAALARTPPLAGGAQRYARDWLQNLPGPGQFSFSYPPHLDHVVHGYRNGCRELAADPAGGALRLLTKAWRSAQGATSGLGGYAVPIGLSGQRPPVDLVVAEGAWAALFRAGVLLFAAAGLWSLRRNAALVPWLVFAATKLAVVLAYFGYARQGALCVPVLMLGVAAAAHRWIAPHLPRRITRLGVGAGVLFVLLEAFRLVTVDVTFVQPGGTPRPGPAPNDHGAMLVEYR